MNEDLPFPLFLLFIAAHIFGLAVAGTASVYVMGQGPADGSLLAILTWELHVFAPLFVFVLGMAVFRAALDRYIWEPDGDGS